MTHQTFIYAASLLVYGALLAMMIGAPIKAKRR